LVESRQLQLADESAKITADKCGKGICQSCVNNGRIASLIANMISVGGRASAGFAEAGALVPPTSVGRAPLFDEDPKIRGLKD
jgi:hypothetical protein